MDAKLQAAQANRPLTPHERRLATWLLEHGNSSAAGFLDQLALAEVTPYRCACGCASIDFKIRDRAEAPPGVHILATFQFMQDGLHCGIFIYSSNGILSGMEVTGYDGDAPRTLPEPEDLIPSAQTA